MSLMVTEYLYVFGFLDLIVSSFVDFVIKCDFCCFDYVVCLILILIYVSCLECVAVRFLGLCMCGFMSDLAFCYLFGLCFINSFV